VNRTSFRMPAAVALALLAGCAHVTGVGGKRISETDPLPPDPGPGFLYIRVVTGSDTKSFAYIVHVANVKDPHLLAIAGPIEDWPVFLGKVRAAYWAHGPGEAYCARNDCKNVERANPPPYKPMPPPIPPPPSDGYAIAYTTQSGTVNPDDSGLAGSATGAAAGAVTALGQ
jgi:hypothetical protein